MREPFHKAPRPSPIAAQDQPWKIDPQIACQIRCTAARMIGKAGLIHQDREDLEQELTVQLLARLPRFDSRRAARMTFVTRTLNNAAANIIAARRREKRDWRASARSLDEVVEDGEGARVPLAELLAVNVRDSLRAAGVQREQQDLRIDLERFMATLSEKESLICALLMREKPGQVARMLGLPRATLYDLTIKLRERFEAAGLKKYL
jgi:RNA polymerase sigma factor (sigma-70 family)